MADLAVSVIVSTHNRHKDCDELLASLAQQTVKPHEVILIDDGSRPPYRPRGLIPENLKLLRPRKELGLGLARLLGTRLATGDLIAFIDDDAIAPKGWIERIREGGGRKGLHVFGGPAIPIYKLGFNPPPWWDDRVLGRYLAICNRAIVGCNFVVRREAFELLGEFRPYLGRYGGKPISNEEVEFTLRAYLAGLKVGFDYGLIVYHKVRPGKLTTPYLLKRAWLQGLSTYLTVRKDLRLALLGRELMASKCPCERIEEPIKISARMMNTLLIAITFLSYLYCFARYTIIGHPISATASQDVLKSLLR